MTGGCSLGVAAVCVGALGLQISPCAEPAPLGPQPLFLLFSCVVTSSGLDLSHCDKLLQVLKVLISFCCFHDLFAFLEEGEAVGLSSHLLCLA